MTSAGPVHHTIIDTPVGELLAVEQGGRLSTLQFMGARVPPIGVDWVRSDEPFTVVAQQLREYFEGSRREFDVPIEPCGTEFQMTVWAALVDIPYGQTATYGDIASAIGRPNAVRAVGGANNANHIPIVIPCHRVIGADGSLTGFGGGLDNKARLLELEEQVVAADRVP